MTPFRSIPLECVYGVLKHVFIECLKYKKGRKETVLWPLISLETVDISLPKLLTGIHPDRLEIGVGIQHSVSHFTTVATLFDSTEGGGGIKNVKGVHPDHPCFQ